MSEQPGHGAKKVHPAKKDEGGGGSKWLISAVAAAALIGGGYFVWQSMTPSRSNSELAINDTYADDPLRAGPVESSQSTGETNFAENDAPTAAPASAAETRPATPARRSTSSSSARTEAVPEQTIGITPASASNYDDDEIVVTARRPVWASTPSARRLSAMYPQRALDRGREGEARLACVVQERGVLDCDQIEATPGGFGPAAERVARTYRHATTLADGRDAVGTPVNLRVVFRIAEEPRRGRA